MQCCVNVFNYYTMNLIWSSVQRERHRKKRGLLHIQLSILIYSAASSARATFSTARSSTSRLMSALCLRACVWVRLHGEWECARVIWCRLTQRPESGKWDQQQHHPKKNSQSREPRLALRVLLIKSLFTMGPEKCEKINLSGGGFSSESKKKCI